MGKRKGGSEISEALISRGGVDDETVGERGGRFFACYLLTSLSPRHKGHTYIGFTVNPRRRIRQHNGEIRSGAWRTKSKRPWEMVLCIYGFPTNVAALQFEWAWQHPIESLAVRKAAATFKSLSGIANKIKLAHTMLTLPAWQSLNLTVNFFSTKYKKHAAGCPKLPEHMKVQVCSMDELPCYTGNDWNVCENDECGDDEECDETSGSQGSVKEGSLDAATVDNFTDHRNNVEESSYEQMEWMERTHGRIGRIGEISMRQPRDSPIQEDDHRQPCFLNNSPVTALSPFASRSSNIETVEDREVFGLIGEHCVELDLPTREQLLTTVAADKGQSPIKKKEKKSPIKKAVVHCEVEVIDMVTPSPSYRISSHSKKRRVSMVCPEIIDLTKSPIFV